MQLKKAMYKNPVLATPDFTKEFIVEFHAFGNGIGVVLMQEGRPISFVSCQLEDKNQLRPIYKKEMLEILHAVKNGGYI